MLDGIALGQYIPADSPIHKLDPRCKLLITVIIMAAVFMADTALIFAIWGAMLILTAKMAKLPFSSILKSVKPILILVIFTSVIHLFFTDGKEIFRAGPISVTYEGIFLAAKMSFRLMYLVMYASILTLTTSPSELSDGIEAVMKPFQRIGFPAHETAMMMTIALRFIPTLFEETDRIMKSQISRGADFESGGLIKRAKSYIPVLIPMFVIVFQRADTLASAMESRCYRGGRGRVRMRPLKWGKNENIFLAAILLFWAAASLTERMVK